MLSRRWSTPPSALSKKYAGATMVYAKPLAQLFLDDGLALEMRYTGGLIGHRDRAEHQVRDPRVVGGAQNRAALGDFGVHASLEPGGHSEHSPDIAHRRDECAAIIQ